VNEYGVVLLHSTSAALRSEKVLQQAGLEIRLIPVPRELSSNCGIAVRFAWPDRERVAQALAEARVEPEGIHPL
jgi:Fe-S oxidoreductase